MSFFLIDNIGVRMITYESEEKEEKNCKAINYLKDIKEMLGHTPLEVIGGIIVGIVVASVL